MKKKAYAGLEYGDTEEGIVANLRCVFRVLQMKLANESGAFTDRNGLETREKRGTGNKRRSNIMRVKNSIRKEMNQRNENTFDT